MGDKHPFRIPHAKRVSLNLCRIDKLRGCYRDRRCTLNLEPYRVMQTARGTGPSVGQCFNHKVIAGLNFLAQLIRRWLGKRWLSVAIERHLG